MTQPPYSPPGSTPSFPMGSPLDYGSTRPLRPTVLTVAAVIGIVVAVISLLCNGTQLALAGAQVSRGATTRPTVPGWMTGVDAVCSIVFLLIAIVWLATSIGLLKDASWSLGIGRKLPILHIVLLVAWIGFNLMYVAPESKRVMEDAMQRGPATGPTSAAFNNGFISGAVYLGPIFSVICALVLPVLMLICLNRPSVKSHFAATM